ncbi:MAG: serine/threonine protein kinase [Myxococcales bacterium]|nr:serine/threonine protein kinase [Myxococcales bacterium]
MESIGAYTLQRCIGEGGMGEVWLGRRPTTVGASKLVAIKLLARRHLEAEGMRELFVQEARLSMSLSHSNIVQVFDVVEEGDRCAMIMEWVDGLDLAQLCKRLRASGRRLSAVQSAFIVGKILRALAYAHELDHRGHKGRIIHRDVSPQNVMISVDGEIKLMDFGIARLTSDESSGARVRGKPRYMPPEQLAGKSREPTVDLFAVGAILHELLDNRKFRSQAADDGQLLGMIVKGWVPPPTVAIPEALDQVRRGLLEPDAERRIASAREALARLGEWSEFRDVSFELEALVREFVPRAEASASGVVSGVALAEAEMATIAQGAQDRQGNEDAGSGDEFVPLTLVTTSTGEDRNTETLEPDAVAQAMAAAEQAIAEQDAVTEQPGEPPRSSSLVSPPIKPANPARQWAVVAVLFVLFVGLLGGALAALGGDRESEVEADEAQETQPATWSRCGEWHEARTCDDVCAELGGTCAVGGCFVDPKSCTGWLCARATSSVGFSDDQCRAPSGSSLSRCQDPLADDRPYARCCCAGLGQ